MAGEKILVVDDDDDILLIVQTILGGAGYSAHTARNGREGVEMALELRPDLILLDVMMPELSGWEVCTTLKNAPETRQAPIAMLTVKNEIRDLITGMQAGADDYITKPFTRRKLLSTVQKLLENRDEAPAAFLTSDDEEVRFKNLLFDPVTRLPTVPVIIDALRDRLLDNRDLGVLFVDVEQYSHIEDAYGWEVFDGLLRETGQALRRMLGTVFATEDFVAVNRAGGSDFYVFTSLEAGDETLARLQRKARQVEESLRGTLDEAFGARIHKRIGVFVGHSVIRSNPQMRVERVVYRALREAINVASTKEEQRQSILRETFKDILRRGRIRTVYQPIFSLSSLELFGHEALTRGPLDTAFESPELLFAFAGENETIWELEQLCLGSSASRYEAHAGPLLFINVEADSVAALSSRGPEALPALFALEGQGRPGGDRALGHPRHSGLPRRLGGTAPARVPDRHRRRGLRLRVASVDRGAASQLPEGRQHAGHGPPCGHDQAGRRRDARQPGAADRRGVRGRRDRDAAGPGRVPPPRDSLRAGVLPGGPRGGSRAQARATDRAGGAPRYRSSPVAPGGVRRRSSGIGLPSTLRCRGIRRPLRRHCV